MWTHTIKSIDEKQYVETDGIEERRSYPKGSMEIKGITNPCHDEGQ